MIIIPVPCLFDNFAYLVGCEVTGECLVVDPSEYYPVYSAALQNNLKVTGVLCTHHHRDHIDGLEDLLADDPDLAVFGHSSDKQRLPGLNRRLQDGDTVQVGRVRGKVYHTPGHTTGSCVYHFQNALFTGDTLFGAGCGRLFEGSAEELYSSLKRIQNTFNPDTLIYPGHNYTLANLRFARSLEPANSAIGAREKLVAGEKESNSWQPASLGLEKETNPFLRCQEESLRFALMAVGHQPGPSAADVFRLVRQLKDTT